MSTPHARTPWPTLPAILALLLASFAHAQDRPLAFTNATLIPVSSPDIENGTLVVHRGRILAVGGPNTPIPPDATRVDARGKVIMPGLVDTHSHIGGGSGADRSATIQPSVRILDSINPFDSGFRRAVAGGLTTLNVMPGSGHLLSGQTIYLKLRAAPSSDADDHRPARTIEDLMIRDQAGIAMGGLKMANGTNPMGAPPFSATRARHAALVREQFIRAQEYRRRMNSDRKPERNLSLEALVEVLEGRRIVHHHTHRADDIATVLRLQREFGFRVVLHHVSEAHKLAPEIAAAAPAEPKGPGVIGCSAIIVDSPGGKLEAAELILETPGVLERAGVNTALHTDDWITDSRLFLRMGALAVRAGMSRQAALRALTLAGAEMLDLEDRIGSLEPGKDADFVVLSGDPFSLYTRVEQTWVEGTLVFDLSRPADRLHAVGGYGAGRDQEPYFCCFGN
jgi:imidazolonepropionase-like amidohydrolase